MWVFLSNRIRTWLVLAVAVPVARRVLNRIAAARAASHPDARSTAALRHADSALGRLQSRRGRGRAS
jgi:hypothetical protein